jgi:AraC family transcriptional regulator
MPQIYKSVTLKIKPMIARKLLTPEPQPTCPTFRFADDTLFTGTVENPYTCPPHIPGAGILTMISGTGRFSLNDENITLDNTQYLLINRGSRLSIRLPRPEAQPLFLFFRAATVDEALTKYDADFCWLERTHPMNTVLKERLEWLVLLGNSCSSFSALKADAMIRDMLQELIRQALDARRIAAALTVTRPSTRIELYRRLSLAREWIIANYSSPATLHDMAEIAMLNSQHFLRMFRDCYGITPHRFLIEVRLDTARQLLTNTKEPVSAIARQTGFESISSFSGLFRQRFGTTPSLYRTTAVPTP